MSFVVENDLSSVIFTNKTVSSILLHHLMTNIKKKNTRSLYFPHRGIKQRVVIFLIKSIVKETGQYNLLPSIRTFNKNISSDIRK